MGGDKHERGAAEWADGVRSGRNRGEFFPERRVFGRAQQMDQRKDGAEGGGKPKHPVEDNLLGFGRHSPRGGSEDEQDGEARPFESATCARMHVGLVVAGSTKPGLMKAERQERNIENVPSIERANLHGAARLRAGETVVVAKGDPLGAEAVQAVDDEHGRGL